jgi:hypothetical protein
MWRTAILTAGLLCAATATGEGQERAAAADTRQPQGLIAEPLALERAALFAGRNLIGSGEARAGIYADVFNMIPGAGWIAGGPGYRQWYAGERIFADASAAISWRGYRTAQARVELPKLAGGKLMLGAQIRWQDFTQVNTFGEGPATLASNHAQYRLRSTNLAGFTTVRPLRWLAVNGQGGWFQPSIRPPSGPFRADRPDARAIFPDDPVFAAPNQPAYLYGEASVVADARDAPDHPTRGGLLRGAAATFSDRDSGALSFRRYEAEGAGFLPLAGARLVVALHGWLVTSDTSAGRHVPFYLQPALGGHNTLRGYADYRFHGRNMLLFTGEARVPLTTHLDVAAFVDAGNVGARLADLNLDTRSYGAGLRLHARRHTFARLDVAHGGEGWRILLRLTDPLNLSRLARRTAPIPFVP